MAAPGVGGLQVGVQVWLLPASRVDEAAAARWLSDAERQRAQRYTSAAARHEFTATRAALRMLLGERLRCAPRDVRIDIGVHGKPRLAAAPGLHFNLSHSGGLGVLALGSTQVGVDVEAVRPLADLAALAGRVFDARDAAAWRALPAGERLAAFYRAWTRKEACAKAGGQGLGADLRAISVRLDAGRDGQLTPLGDAAGWALYDLGIATVDGFAAALACTPACRPSGPPHWLDAAVFQSSPPA